jgi:predicted RND superfamily exporter protein
MGSAEYNRRIDHLLENISRIATDNPRKIIMTSTVIILLSVAGATQIRFSHFPLQWFPKDNIIRTDTEAIDRIMRGSMTIEVVCKRYFDDKFPDLRYEVTGMISLLARTISNTITSLTKSYAIAMAVITILMVLLIGRVRIGMLSMIPNLAPILLTLGIIGALGFPMDMFIMMVASIAIGLGF